MERLTLPDVVEDFAAEAAALDELLAGMDDADWSRPTPAEGWDVRDTVSHLADTDDLAHDCATGGPRDLMTEAITAGSGEAFTHGQVLKGRDRTPSEVHDWWRTSNERLRDALLRVDPAHRIPWGPNQMSPVSFTTARLMETWAHSLDCHAAVEREPVDTDRIRHVAFIGLRALPYALGTRGLQLSGPVRLELTGPSGDEWTLGPPGAPTVIRGSASDWCRVVTHRDRGDERSRLGASGPDADRILTHAQAYL
ncbi:MAG TPA: maleylpyruvate isomerase family mycothiol-dependent enzyme [Actinomycetota bacterium]|nr:maleylpyruvate isomerase family mycothiol-dependent enzyme [Actinomycetota bacterium]